VQKNVFIQRAGNTSDYQWCTPVGKGMPVALRTGSLDQLQQELEADQEASLCLVPPIESVTIRELELGEGERKYASNTVPFLVEDQLADEIETLHFALDKSADHVAIMDKALLSDCLAPFQDFDFNIDSCIPAQMLLPYQENCWLLHYDGTYCIIRTGKTSGFIIHKELLPTFLTSLVEKHGMPTAGIKAFVDEQHQDSELIALFPEALAEKLSVENKPLLTVAAANSDITEEINLLQGEFITSTQWVKVWNRWRLAAYALLALVVLQTGASYFEYNSLAKDNLAMRQNMEKLYRELFPRGVVVNPEHQMRTQLNELRKNSGGNNFVSQYATIGKVLNQFQGALLSSMNYDGNRGEFRLNLTLADYQAVDKLRSRLAAAGLVADLLSSNADNDRVQARLRITSSLEAS
jgi:type II secretion system protein L